MFVEVVELDDAGEPIDSTWTTLPDADGHATQARRPELPAAPERARTGATCTRSSSTTRRSRHGDDCDPTGTTGDVERATGISGGWADWTTST